MGKFYVSAPAASRWLDVLEPFDPRFSRTCHNSTSNGFSLAAEFPSIAGLMPWSMICAARNVWVRSI